MEFMVWHPTLGSVVGKSTVPPNFLTNTFVHKALHRLGIAYSRDTTVFARHNFFLCTLRSMVWECLIALLCRARALTC